MHTPTAAGVDPAGDIYSVSRLNAAARALLDRHFGAIWVEGEISNLARPASGHWYFTLKDAGAQVRCAMFRGRNSMTVFVPDNGMHVLAHARVGIYEARGDYQLIVDHLEPVGEGLLRLQFEQLKRRLAAEGLFALEAKRPLPAWPRVIGVVTSPTGAAIRDILHVLARRSPATPVIVYPCSVQGVGAAAEIAAAIDTACARAECDVLIVARGGGSLEDLWAFNEEAVARALFRATIPVISAVGHEIDFTIADLAADVRAPTPSAGAEMASRDRHEAARSFAALERRLRAAAAAGIAARAAGLRQLVRVLVDPRRRIEQCQQRVDELAQRLPLAAARELSLRRARLETLVTRAVAQSPLRRMAFARERLRHFDKRLSTSVTTRIASLQAELTQAQRALRAVDPLATLGRGYAIVVDAHGNIARDAGVFTRGDRVTARLARGELDCAVELVRATDADRGETP